MPAVHRQASSLRTRDCAQQISTNSVTVTRHSDRTSWNNLKLYREIDCYPTRLIFYCKLPFPPEAVTAGCGGTAVFQPTVQIRPWKHVLPAASQRAAQVAPQSLSSPPARGTRGPCATLRGKPSQHGGLHSARCCAALVLVHRRLAPHGRHLAS